MCSLHPNLSLSRAASRRRRGVVALELVVVLPVLVFSLMFMVHMGVSLSGGMIVHQAATAGARRAAESVRGNAGATNLAVVVKQTVNTVLVSSGISTDSAGPGTWCAENLQVVVQERVSDAPDYLGSSAASGFPFISTVPAASAIPAETVRVWVFVRQSELVPDLLAGFGVSLTGRYLQASALQPWNGSL